MHSTTTNVLIPFSPPISPRDGFFFGGGGGCANSVQKTLSWISAISAITSSSDGCERMNQFEMFK